MTLVEIYDKVKAAIDKATAQEPDAAKRTTGLSNETIADDCFKQVPSLLGSRDEIRFLGNVGLTPNDRAKLTGTLAIEGKAGILGRESDTKISLRDSNTSRTCLVEVKSLGRLRPGDSVETKPFKIGDIEFPLFDSSVPILDKPKIELTNLGFVLESFLGGALKRPDARFRATGKFKVDTAEVSGEVELPVARIRGSNQWHVTFDAGEMPLTPKQLANWLTPSEVEPRVEIFENIPAEIVALGFGLKRLRIDFDRKLLRVGAIQTVFATNKALEFADKLALQEIALRIDIVSPFALPDISARLEAKLKVKEVAPDAALAAGLKAVMTVGLGSRDSIISFYGEPFDAEFTLGQLSSLLEGFDLIDLQIPIDSKLKLLRLIDLTFALQLNATPKLRSIRLAAATTMRWEIIDKVLSIANPYFSLELTKPRESKTWQVSARLVGIVALLEKFQANFEMTRSQGRWILTAQALEEIPLANIFGVASGKEKLGVDFPEDLQFSKELAALKLSGLQARYATQTAKHPTEFSFSATVVRIPGFRLGNVAVNVQSFSVELSSSKKDNEQRQTSIILKGSFLFDTVPLSIAFNYQRGRERSWRVMIEALGFRGEYSTTGKTAKIDLGNRNIGEILRDVYSLVEPGVTIRLPEPWNELERISLQGASLIFDSEKRSFGVTYEFGSEVPLVFARLRKIGITYAGGRSVRMTVEGRLFNEAKDRAFTFDPRNPGPLPLPSTKAAPIDLRFLALGQRLRLETNEEIPEIKRVRDALGLMKQAFSKENPSELLLAKDPGLTFDPQSGLLVGADFSLLGTLSTALVFNDGVVAGVSLGLSGTLARYFRGLDFEILYKKVAEGIGVYQTEVRLPDSIRQIELGAVSMTIPELALEIYTNGNFRVDLGFPRNNDFSRSFQLQVFPYLGKGGFYFARLEGRTTPRLPADYDPRRGKFDPVLAFGLGLSVGIGKSINRGVLAAELSITFEGIVEGVLAFFTAERVGDKQIAADSLYYWAQGTIGIVGRIRGRASFSVITADVSLVVEARIGIMLESFRPLMLTFKAAVNVDLVVRIGAGWLSVDINCSFSTTISEQLEFPVRNPGLPAWAVQPGAPASRSLPGSRLPLTDALAAPNLASLAWAASAPQPLPEMTWNPIIPDDTPEELRLLFRPQFTVAEDKKEGQMMKVPPQSAHCVALLFLKSVGTADKVEEPAEPIAVANPVESEIQSMPSDFDRLAEAMLLWCINSLLNRGTLTDRKTILRREISVEDLEKIYRVLTCGPDGAAPFTGAQVTAFLRTYFDIIIQAEQRPERGIVPDDAYYDRDRPMVAAFPMIPELRVEARLTVEVDPRDSTKNFELLHYSARFDKQTVVQPSYHREIAQHFESMAPEFRTKLEKTTDKAAADPPPEEVESAGGRSIAEFVFEDYFLMIARDIVQSSLDLVKTRSHLHTSGDETLVNLATHFGVSIERIVAENPGLKIGKGLAIQAGGATTTTTADESFSAISARFGERSNSSLIEEIGRANAFASGLLTAGVITIRLGEAAEVAYTVDEKDTLDSVSGVLRLEGGPGELAALIASSPGYLNSGIRILVPIYARRQTAGRTTVDDLAKVFTGVGDSEARENLQFARDLGVLNAYVNDLIVPGTMLMVSTAPYTVKPGDTLASIAAGKMPSVTPMDILEANRFKTGIFSEGVELTIPPTSRLSGDKDTLQSVATQMGIPAGLLAANNAHIPGFLVKGQQLAFPSIKVETLLKELRAPNGAKGPNKFLNLSGMVSRFMLPGVRLPKPSSLLKDERNLWPGNGNEGAPLYAMTGQQFELPEFKKQYVGCMIDLIPPDDGAAYRYVMTGRKLPPGDQAPYTEDEEVEKLTIELQKDELDWIDELRKTDLAITLKLFQKVPISIKDKDGKPRDKDRRRFAVSNGVKLAGSRRFSLGPSKDNPSGAPTIWILAEGVRRAISESRDELSAFKLEAGEQARENGEVTFREADAYDWATAFNVRIRKVVPASDLPQPPKLLEMAYEIDGLDAEGVLLLEGILRRAGSKLDESFIKEVRILYPSKAELVSKDGVSAFILQTNLSTLSSPRSLTRGSLASAAEPVVSKLEMLRLLLQASIVRSGGYYLFYRTNDPVEGLPAEIFDNGTAEITILVTFDFQVPDRVASFVNRAFVSDTGLVNGAKLFATSLDLFLKQPLLPPGHTGFVVRRAQPVWELLDEAGQPQIDPPAPEQLEFLYSLLACRVAANDSFRESVEVSAEGPEGALENFDEDPRKKLAWQYTKVIPAFKFFKLDPVGLPAELAEARKLLPDPYGNPYRGVGYKLPLRFDWLDGFGNKTPWNSKSFPNPQSFGVRLGYTDELIGVERWPAVSAGYSIETKDITKPELAIMFDFDVSRNTPRADGQGSLADSKRVAKADLEVFRKIFYQLTDGNTKIKLHTTIDDKSEESDSVVVIDKQSEEPVWKNVIGFIGDIIRYLTQVSAPDYKFRYGFGVAPESLERIAGRSGVKVYELRRLNPELPDVLVESTELLLPDLFLPKRLQLNRRVSLSNMKPLFPLTVKVVLERMDRPGEASLVDEEFRDVAGTKLVAHEVEPLAVVAGNGGGRANGAIRDFARKFEQAFTSTKLATGLARAGDADSESRNRLWVVRIGSAITYQVDPKSQHFFAPIPLATTLLGATHLAVFGYNKEQQALVGVEKSYAGIDLDEWARRFLSAMDTFFMPQYAVPAYILDKQGYQAILEDKRRIARSIADSVEGIAEGTGGDQGQAKELLRQRMLVNLSAAYDVDTIVQIGVKVQSPFKKPDKTPETRSDYAPKFYGQPVGKLAAPGPDQPPEKLDFTLSTAKIPLVVGSSYLTFLFDSEKVEPEQLLKLNLSYQATALEHEISDMPGVEDLRSSSWLTFIIPENVIPNAKPIEVKVPIPIRADPIRPSVETQAVEPAYPDGQDLKLEETREYAYSYQYSRGRSARDLVYTSPRFNSVKPAEEAKREAVSSMDLFQALASFDGAWDAIRQDLMGALPDLKSADTSVEAKKTLNALKAFAKLVSLIATAWKTWHEKEMPPVGPPEPGDRYKYDQKQVTGVNDYVISETSEKESAPWQITVRKCNGPFDAPIPSIEIKDWEQVEIEPANPNERRFQFNAKEAKGAFMTEKDVKQELGIGNRITRVVVFKNTAAANESDAAKTRKQAALDILNKENAWPELRITRNETLFGDVACAEGSSPRTNPSFVYHTPWVRFAQILKPRIEYGRTIDIAKLPKEQGKDPDTVLQQPLVDHLSRLFKRFFESVPNPGGEKPAKRRTQLTCRYQYDLNKPANENDLLVITLPIVMAPPFDFTIPDSKNSAAKSFPQSLAEAIKTWLDERSPSGNNGRFVFDISVYSSLGESKLPIYRLSNLQLGVKKDPVKGEWVFSSTE